MKKYCVIYRESASIISAILPPLARIFEAEDIDHVEEQMLNFIPDCVICWVGTGNIEDTLAEYYSD